MPSSAASAAAFHAVTCYEYFAVNLIRLKSNIASLNNIRRPFQDRSVFYVL